MKYQALFSLKGRKIKFRLLQFFSGALRANRFSMHTGKLCYMYQLNKTIRKK